KDQSSLRKNKNNKKKTVKQLKLRVGLIVFWYLKVSFFPDTFLKHSCTGHCTNSSSDNCC
ncbi:hypothetical protein P5719_011120, partial [Lactobacillus amylovorus]|uniref:hypothetical protein n=1 Tax=Lactobacillus amylovorus TaxID=1604 RepID=UPI00313DF2AE